MYTYLRFRDGYFRNKVACFPNTCYQMLCQKPGASVNIYQYNRIIFWESLIASTEEEKHVNPQHKVKQFSVIKITSVRDMEISHVLVSKSLGNCEHLYNQMSSESLGEFEKVRTQLPQSRAGRSLHFATSQTDGYALASHRRAPNQAIFTPTDTPRVARAMFNLWSFSWKGLQLHTGLRRVGVWKVSREQRGSFNGVNEPALRLF